MKDYEKYKIEPDMIVAKNNNYTTETWQLEEDIIKREALNGIVNIFNTFIMIAVIVLAIVSIVKNVKRKNTARIVISSIMLVISFFGTIINRAFSILTRLASDRIASVNIALALSILILIVQVVFIVVLVRMISKSNKYET